MYMRQFAVIEAVEVDRLSEKSAWMHGKKHVLNSEWQSFHKTWKEAHDCMVADFSRQIDSAEARLEYAKRNLDKALAMKPPAECGDDQKGGGK